MTPSSLSFDTSLQTTRPSFVSRPRSAEETGLSHEFIGSLVCKHLHVGGILDLHELSERLALAGNIVETIIEALKKDGMVEILAASNVSRGLRYSITDKGRSEAMAALMKSGYTGPAPITLEHYRKVVRAQSVQNTQITREVVQKAFEDTTINPDILNQLGPAMHSGRAIMVYGLPGTGKTFICKRLTRLLGSTVYLPHAIAIGESVVQIFDPIVHEEINDNDDPLSMNLGQGYDPRFKHCRRPVAISGGELTMDMLEIDHDRQTRLSQAPLQLKANNGMYIIDDLGRQRVPVVELFNRWIVPLEEKHDYLTLDTGKRIQVPFDVILLFSANINPSDLADEAFLRRLGYKIKFPPVNELEYKEIWKLYCDELNVECPDVVLEEVLERYRQEKKPLLPCHPRDLLGLIKDQCLYQEGKNSGARQATPDRLSLAWNSYFINFQDAKVD